MTIPEGVEVAKKSLSELLPDIDDTWQLEELETPPYGTNWRFTFTATVNPNTPATGLAAILRSRRVAKQVEIDSQSGSLISIKNAAA